MQKKAIINGKSIQLTLRSDADESVFNEVLIDRDYRILDEAIQKAKTIIDVGAHIGAFSIYAATINPNAQITAYEPELSNFKALKENLKLNHTANITPKNLAVAGKQGQRTFYISEDSHNHSLTQDLPNQASETSIQTTTLTQIIQKHGHIDLLKIDCEGAEFEIFAEAGSTHEALVQIALIHLEYHEYEHQVQELEKILQSAGFKTKRTPSHYDKRMGYIIAKSTWK